MQITDYVKPELIVVALVLYFVGMWIKQSEAVKDRYIPLINGGLAGNFHGNIYRHNPGNPAGRAEHVCQSNHKADRQGGIEGGIHGVSLF